MRVSREKMAEHRETIISSAAKRFRERGFEGISVADLMKEAELTHGGFYGHFESKEELIALAAERALRDSTAKWEKILDGAKSDPLQALADTYLSQRHCDNPGTGCIFPALGSEISRQPESVRNVVTQGLQRFVGLLGRAIKGKSPAQRRRKAIVAYASMIGGMLLARSTSDPVLCREILRTVSESLSSDGVSSNLTAK